VDELPALAAVGGEGERIRCQRRRGEVAADREPMLLAVEGERENPGRRAAVHRRRAHLPALALVVGAENARLRRTTAREPRPVPVVGDETLAAGCEGELAGERRRHLRGDDVPAVPAVG